MLHAAFIKAIRFFWPISIFLLPFAAACAQATQFASAMDCRIQWDDEFDSYAKQYKKCGQECWSGDARRHEYLRYSDWLSRLEQWHDYCRVMNGVELQLKEPHQAGQDIGRKQAGTANTAKSASDITAWPISLSTAGQSSCELIRSGEVKFKFQWKEKQGKRCYSNTGVRKNVAACCP